jgi:hypothetical protein
VRTSWPTLSEQTGLTPNHVETPVAIRDLLATQPWWRPSADGRPSPTAPETDRPARKGVPR